MEKVFEDVFMDLQKEMVINSLEYLGDTKISNIYLYYTFNEEGEYFNAGFKLIDDSLSIKKAEGIDINEEKLSQFLNEGKKIAINIKEACEKYNNSVPKEITLNYDVRMGQFKIDYNYEKMILDSESTFSYWINELNELDNKAEEANYEIIHENKLPIPPGGRKNMGGRKRRIKNEEK